ncbi:MAG: hypothetical protein AAB493_02310 [Patescibacteria group bacterium]
MKINKNKKIVVGVFIFVFLLMLFSFLIGDAFAVTVTDNVVVTLDVTTGITISDGLPVTMSPNIGITSNGAIGSSSWIVKTNAALGYTLAVKADASPALRVLAVPANNFADYTEAVSGTPELWSVASGAKEFGYSAYGTDTSTATWGTSASCGAAGVPAVAQKYVGFLITDKMIATRATVTPTSGVTTTICFAAEQNGIYAPSGTYTATVTATAITL